MTDPNAGPDVRARRSTSGRPMRNIDLVDALCSASTTLQEARRLHEKSYGTLIPHVFMADVLKRIGACLGSGLDTTPDENRREIQALLDVLERGMTDGDRETCNVIAISFTRDSEVETFFLQLMPLLGPRTRAQLKGK